MSQGSHDASSTRCIRTVLKHHKSSVSLGHKQHGTTNSNSPRPKLQPLRDEEVQVLLDRWRETMCSDAPMATCAMCAAFTTDFLRWEVDKLGVVRWGDTPPTADDVEIRHLVPLASPSGELEWFALHEQGLVEDVTGMYSLETSAIKANVCEDCGSVLKAAQKKRSKRKPPGTRLNSIPTLLTWLTMRL